MTNRSQTPQHWHALDLSELHKILDSSDKGLSRTEAEARLQEYGPNQLPETPPPTLWQLILRQFQSPLIYILGIAAIVALLINKPIDAIFIAIVLVLNAAIGAFQEWRAEQSSHALRQLLQIQASVQRDGEVYEVSADQIVPGDVIWLESGDRIPADLRLLSATGFEVDESLLTGESVPVTKDSGWLGEENTPMGDHSNMAYGGATVTRGRAKGLAVATGTATMVGRLALDVIGGEGAKSPLLVRMEHFTKVIAVVVLVASVGIGLLGLALGRYEFADMLLFIIAVAVSVIPEGLPISMTVALSIAATRMARRGVIVRRLAAVEALGSCTFIATDKTGTLTVNELTVQEICLPGEETFSVTGQGFIPEGQVLRNGEPVTPDDHPDLAKLARAAILCNEASLHHRNAHWRWRGDAVDIALLAMGYKLGWTHEEMLDRYPLINQIPFEPEHRYAATYHRVDGRQMVFVKGAPERVMEMCDFGENTQEVTRLQETAESMATRGYRVLALAEAILAEEVDPQESPPDPSGLTLLGFVGMIDPLRPGVRDAIATCHSAGIRVSMVTGDHQATAMAIAKDLNLVANGASSNGAGKERVVTGGQMAQMSPEELQDAVKEVTVFARVAPHQKLELVNAALDAGHFVAVTGDGVNDAPALKSANIGVAMGKSGTDVAREASELVISDDNFVTIVAGVEEGRVAYDNIRKVTYLLISTGAAELLLIASAIVVGLPLPLLPAQILWLNLVTNGIQDKALAFEPGEGNALRRPPRSPDEPIFNRLMIERTVLAAVAMAVIGLSAFNWLLESGWAEESARNGLFLLMVLFQNVHVGNSRSETRSLFRMNPLKNPYLFFGVIIALAVHVIALYTPFLQVVLGTEPVALETWVTLFALAVILLPVMEIHKWTWRRRYPERIRSKA
jgi:P-type Ca2+ transporter type 2C